MRPIIKHDMGADFNPVTPLIHIENEGGYSDSMMTVTFPIKVPNGHYAIAMIYSKENGFELLPTIALSENEITILTNHFDAKTLSEKGGRIIKGGKMTSFSKVLILWFILSVH
jgi:hypothetical protein